MENLLREERAEVINLHIFASLLTEGCQSEADLELYDSKQREERAAGQEWSS